MTTKLFISYRSLDSHQVDRIVSQLKNLKDTKGDPLYDVWQDKAGLTVAQNWWLEIVKAIKRCEIFVFMISRTSVKSDNCLAELSYACKRNRPVVPFVLEGEFDYDAQKGKNSLGYWDLIPEELTDLRSQFLFYEGSGYVDQFNRSVEMFIAQERPDVEVPFPPDPSNITDTSNNILSIYNDACDYAYRGDLKTADRLFRRLLNWEDEVYKAYAYKWILILNDYEDILNHDTLTYTQFRVPSLWDEYKKKFPMPFVELFDPKNLASKYDSNIVASKTDRVSETDQFELFISQIELSTRAISDIIGEPFDWCEVPEGEFLYGYGNDIHKLPAYYIAKFPITYAQFGRFIVDGYDDDRWWAGLSYRHTIPGDQTWKLNYHPRENLSWYDAIAFCRWLSYKLGGGFDIGNVSEWSVRLPTEFEWERSAEGTDGRDYPWGNDYNAEKFNVRESNISRTTPVTNYLESASPYGVLDMAGNVWDWCLSNYENPQLDAQDEDLISNTQRSLRGGCWSLDGINGRTSWGLGTVPTIRSSAVGFRIMRPL